MESKAFEGKSNAARTSSKDLQPASGGTTADKEHNKTESSLCGSDRTDNPDQNAKAEGQGLSEDTTLTFDIQPLPTPGAPAEAIPGAHAVSGAPVGGCPSTNRAPQQVVSQSTGCTTNVIDGAILVDEMEDLEAPNSTTRGMDESSTLATRELELVDAKAIHQGRNNERSQNWRFLPLVLILLALAGGLVPLLVVAPWSHTACVGNTTASSNEEHILYPPFSEELNLDILSGINDTTSFYYLANAWMNKDPNLDTYSPARKIQRFNMAYLYFASDGPNWFQKDHWLSYNVSECNWFNQKSSLGVDGWNPGVDPEPACDNEGNVVVLNLTSNNLRGEAIVSSHGISPTLKAVDLSNNHLFGPVPFLADHSISLEVFVLSNNNFTGLLTGGGGFSAFNIRIVKLDGNALFGYFPYIYKLLPKLEVMNVTGNLYDRDISTYFEHCRNLTYLGLGQNLYTGQLPSELGYLTALKELDVSGNVGLSGTLPTELGQLSQLAVMNIKGTSIRGNIPESLCARVDNSTPSLHLSADCDVVRCCL